MPSRVSWVCGSVLSCPLLVRSWSFQHKACPGALVICLVLCLDTLWALVIRRGQDIQREPCLKRFLHGAFESGFGPSTVRLDCQIGTNAGGSCGSTSLSSQQSSSKTTQICAGAEYTYQPVAHKVAAWDPKVMGFRVLITRTPTKWTPNFWKKHMSHAQNFLYKAS